MLVGVNVKQLGLTDFSGEITDYTAGITCAVSIELLVGGHQMVHGSYKVSK